MTDTTTSETDEQIVARAADAAHAGELVDYDTIPKHLWDRVGTSVPWRATAAAARRINTRHLRASL